MGRIMNIGRSGRITYGTQATFTFGIRFQSEGYVNAAGMNPKWDILNPYYTADANSYHPTAGTITVAGASVTLVAADILNPALIAAKIVSSGVSGYTATSYTLPMNPDMSYISLTSTSVGPLAKPDVVLGTATGIFFFDKTFVDGAVLGTIGDRDDIYVGGRTPITITVTNTGGIIPDIKSAYGTFADQAAGTLVYGSAIVLTGGQATLTAPVNWLRMTTKASNTQANLWITR